MIISQLIDYLHVHNVENSGSQSNTTVCHLLLDKVQEMGNFEFLVVYTNSTPLDS